MIQLQNLLNFKLYHKLYAINERAFKVVFVIVPRKQSDWEILILGILYLGTSIDLTSAVSLSHKLSRDLALAIDSN